VSDTTGDEQRCKADQQKKLYYKNLNAVSKTRTRHCEHSKAISVDL